MFYREQKSALQSLGEEGTFCGYASVFNTIDSHKDCVAPGAFQRSLKEWQAKGGLPKMLWYHRLDRPIGVWTQMKETPKGLWVEGQLLLDIPKAQEAYTLLKAGVLDALSIGFHIKQSVKEKKYRVLQEIDLVEVSLVTFGANKEAKVLSWKSDHEDDVPTSSLFLKRLVDLSERVNSTNFKG